MGTTQLGENRFLSRLGNFAPGLVTFFSALDQEGFQIFKNVNNLKRGQVDKVKGQGNKSTTQNVDNYTNVEGQGFFTYRSEKNQSDASVSTFWWLTYLKVSAAFKILRCSADSTGLWGEIIAQGGALWPGTA